MTTYAENEELAKRFPMVYSADGKKRISVKQIVDGLRNLINQGYRGNDLADYIDEVFLFGSWGEWARRLPPTMLDNIRGLLVTAISEHVNLPVRSDLPKVPDRWCFVSIESSVLQALERRIAALEEAHERTADSQLVFKRMNKDEIEQFRRAHGGGDVFVASWTVQTEEGDHALRNEEGEERSEAGD